MRATIDWDGVDWDSEKARLISLIEATRKKYGITEVRVRVSCMDGMHVVVSHYKGSPLSLRKEWRDDQVRLALDTVRSKRAKLPSVALWYKEGTLFNRKWLPSGEVLNAGPWVVVWRSNGELPMVEGAM